MSSASLIEKIRAVQILDSRGKPTVRCFVTLRSGAMGVSSVPSGASTGKNEAHEKRDGLSAYGGKGVLGAVKSIDGPINDALTGTDVLCQSALDKRLLSLDASPDKSVLGANAILAVSMAAARAAANHLGLPLYRYLGGVHADTLPVPMMNIINGGRHAGNNLDIQEFMIRPVGAKRFDEAVQMGAAVYESLKKCLADRRLPTSVGDEGGFAPDLPSDRAAIELILQAIEQAGYRPGADVALALDAAASEWAQPDGTYRLSKAGTRLTREDLIEHYLSLFRDFPIDSIEDPLGEEDFGGFASLKKRLTGAQIVGDDLFTTNPQRLKKGIQLGCATAVLIKPNQIGTVSETLECIRTAHNAGWKTVISHRSGETADAFIADLAVAVNAGQIKAGAPARSDRTEKYNRLVEIEAELRRPLR